MIFQLRMLCDEDDYFVREYEVPYDMTLTALRTFINHDLHYNSDQFTSFFTADARWNKLSEFTSMDMEMESIEGQTPRSMDEVLLSQILHQNRDRLIYQFDPFGERALYLELTGAMKAEAKVHYPRVTQSEGVAPNPEAPLDGEQSGGHSIFDDAMSDFNDFEGDDHYDDE